MAEVSLHPAAAAEYAHALEWYHQRSLQAAAGFEADVEQALDFIARFPLAQPLCDKRHRYYALKRYPYGIVYRVDGEQVRVVAVPHSRQLPGYWMGLP